MKIEMIEKKNFEINKFFYRQVGKDHYWRDRLIWTDKQWLNYTSNKNLDTWILKKQEQLVGFYELEQHHQKNEVELINLGVLKEYRQNGFGTSLLKHLIKFYSEKNFPESGFTRVLWIINMHCQITNHKVLEFLKRKK